MRSAGRRKAGGGPWRLRVRFRPGARGTVEFTTDRADVAAFLRGWLGGLETRLGGGRGRRSPGVLRLRLAETGRGRPLAAALAELVRRARVSAFDAPGARFRAAHASAVERDGQAALLVGASGSGKSTLAAALALDGWGLLADDFAVLEPAAGRVWPQPGAVKLDRKARAALGLPRGFGLPWPGTEIGGSGDGERYADLVGSGRARPGRRARLAHVLLLERARRGRGKRRRRDGGGRGGEPSVVPLGPGEGMILLAAALAGASEDLPGAIEAAARVAARARLWRVVPGRVRETAAAVAGALTGRDGRARSERKAGSG